jgi:hypothetical protein
MPTPNRRSTVLKKVGIAVGITAAALMVLTPLAFADDDSYGGNGEHVQLLPGVQGKVFQHPVNYSNGSYLEGHKHNSDSHDGDADQDISPSDD